MTELIETTQYHTLHSGVQMTMKVSERFQSWNSGGGYAYVCFPWVDRNQWHAFSLFENPKAPKERQIFMQRTGDWTNRVHELLQRDSVRPVWIMGPFPSPYKNAIKYDNQILVAAGIGITPALSVIRAHKDHRCINLIWAVRDPAMLQFFLEHALLDNRGWNLIFYTGKEPLVSSLIDGIERTNVCIIHSRPNLDDLIPNIVYGFETGKGRPERYLPNKKAEAIEQVRERLNVLDMEPGMTPKEKICDLATHTEGLGYIFYDLVSSLEDIDENLCFKNSSSSTCLDLTLSMSCSTDYTASGDELEVDPEIALPNADRQTATSVDEKVLHKLRKYTFNQPSGFSNKFCDETADTNNKQLRESVLRDQWTGLMDDMTQNFKPWEHHAAAAPAVSELDKTMVKSTWGILYCGGQGKLLTNLQKAAKNADIKLHEESFSW